MTSGPCHSVQSPYSYSTIEIGERKGTVSQKHHEGAPRGPEKPDRQEAEVRDALESCFRFVAEQFDRQQQDKVEDEDHEDQQGADTIGDGIAVRHEARTHEVPEVDG